MKFQIGHTIVRITREAPTFGHCENCHWFVPSVETVSGKIGACHRMAPISGPTGKTFFPRMNGNQGCGQWMAPRNGGVR